MKLIEALDKRCGIYDIDPDMATEMLTNEGAKNRPPSKGRIMKYATEMKRGKWRVSGEPILLDKEGKLIDGQHRLKACILAEKTFRTVVLYGPWPFKVIGQGRPRNAADVLGIEGIANPISIASAARLVIVHGRAMAREASMFTNPSRTDENWKFVSNEDIEAWVSKHPHVQEYFHIVRKAAGGSASLIPLAPMTAAFVLAGESSKDWFIGLASGVGLESGDIRLLLRRAYQRFREGKRISINSMNTFADICKAWNYRKKKGMMTFARKENEPFAFIRES